MMYCSFRCTICNHTTGTAIGDRCCSGKDEKTTWCKFLGSYRCCNGWCPDWLPQRKINISDEIIRCTVTTTPTTSNIDNSLIQTVISYDSYKVVWFILNSPGTDSHDARASRTCVPCSFKVSWRTIIFWSAWSFATRSIEIVLYPFCLNKLRTARPSWPQPP